MADQPVEVGTPGIGTPGIGTPPEISAKPSAVLRPRRLEMRAAIRNLRVQLRQHRRLVFGASSAFIFLLLVLAVDLALYGSPAWAYDFKAYYEAVQRIFNGMSPYQPDLTLSGPFRAGPYGLYLYSPVPVVALLPLGLLNLSHAALVYLGIRLVMLIAMCALMPISRVARMATLAVACLSAPFIQDLNLGNASLVVTFFAVVAWRYLDRPASAAAIAASITIRPTMALFALWWLVRGRLLTVAWVVVAGIVLVLLTLPFVGIRGWLDYWAMLGKLTDFGHVIRNFALGALLTRAQWAPWAADLGLFGGYALAVVAVLASLRRDRELSFVVVLGATLLLSPLLWDHYFTNLLVPAAFLAGRGRWWGLLLPLLCWLPQETLAFIAIAGMLLPFAAPDRGAPVRTVLDRLPMWRKQPAPA